MSGVVKVDMLINEDIEPEYLASVMYLRSKLPAVYLAYDKAEMIVGQKIYTSLFSMFVL